MAMHAKPRGLVLVVAVTLALASLATVHLASAGKQTRAAFPGRNGAIVFEHDPRTGSVEGLSLSMVGWRGGSLRLIALHAWNGAWSPDGRRLSVNGGYDVKVLPRAPTIVVTEGESWSPDGRRLVGINADDPTCEVFIEDLTSGKERLIYEREMGGPFYGDPPGHPTVD